MENLLFKQSMNRAMLDDGKQKLREIRNGEKH
jgi:hypothetical protein